jgi:hypothetical protein
METAWPDSSGAPSPRAEVRVARDRDELEAAFRLVYRLYRQREYSRPHPACLRYVWHLGLPGSCTIISETSEQLIGTMSCIPDGPFGLPMDSNFGPELKALRASGKRIAEAMSLAIDAPAGIPVWQVFFGLTRFLVQYAIWHGADELAIAVHPNHTPFYCRHLGFTAFGSCRPYQWAEGHPATACRLDLGQVARSQAVRPSLLRMYLDDPVSEGQFQHPDMSPADHRYFCRKMQWDPASAPELVSASRLRRPA